MDVVRTIADRIAVMEQGKVVEVGTTYEIFSSPKTEIARKFVSTIQHTEPNAEELAHLRAQHSGRLFTVEITPDSHVGRILSDGAVSGVRFEVVHGGISSLQSKSFGNLTVELRGNDDDVQRVVNQLADVTQVKELTA